MPVAVAEVHTSNRPLSGSELAASNATVTSTDTGKGKNVTVIPKPNPREYEDLIQAEMAMADKYRDELAAVTVRIEEMNGGRESFIKERDTLRERINQKTKTIDNLMSQIKQLNAEMTEHNQHGRKLRAQLDTATKNLKYRTPDEINAKIKQLEYDMMTSQLSLAEERQMLAQIQSLHRTIPELQRVKDLEDTVKLVENSNTGDYQSQMNELNDRLRAARESRRADQDELTRLTEERRNALGPFQELQEKRDQLRRDMNQRKANAVKLRQELQAKETEYKAHQARERATRMSIDRYERQLEALAIERRAVLRDLATANNIKENPKTRVARQLLDYLRGIIKPQQMKEQADCMEGCRPTVDVTNSSTIVSGLGHEYEVMTNKKTDNILSAGGKKDKKAKKKSKKIGSPVEMESGHIISHEFQTLKDFAEVGITDIPMDIKSVEETICILEQQIAKKDEAMTSVYEARDRKIADIQNRLKLIESKEANLIANPPEGWKPKKKTDKSSEPKQNI